MNPIGVNSKFYLSPKKTIVGSSTRDRADRRSHLAGRRPNNSFSEYWLRIDVPEHPAPGFPVKEIEEDIGELVKRHAELIANTP
ncbi:hypothetical protein CVT25_002570 [Psilocybe cyanescens]|uniref:Uncharacterized protein n=1 Tax=Psilocybe cyanescens TaxID=93625 RepID=A0A409WLH7_PSICY|nr:hypothetical protein CVT25_002570 [Psilocybe cyanescens]